MSKKKRKPAKKPLSRHVGASRNSFHYEITSEPIMGERYLSLPRHVRDAFERIYGLVDTDPDKAIDEIQGWLKQYPDIPMLYNFLFAAYSGIGEEQKADEITLLNYHKNPDYLFARLNYAEMLIAKGDYAKAGEVLEHKFDLQDLYPDRNRFHISEYVGFMNVVGMYLAGTGEQDAAWLVYEVLEKVAPDSAATLKLRAELASGPLKRLADDLLKRRDRIRRRKEE